MVEDERKSKGIEGCQKCLHNEKRLTALIQKVEILETANITLQQTVLGLSSQVKILQDSVEELLKKLKL